MQVDDRNRAKYEPIVNKYVSFLLNRNNITWSYMFLFSQVSSRDLKLFRDAKSQTFQYELKHFSLNSLPPIFMVFIYISPLRLPLVNTCLNLVEILNYMKLI